MTLNATQGKALVQLIASLPGEELGLFDLDGGETA